MKKNSVVQFVCFVTNMDFDDFIAKWEPYAKRLAGQGEIMLQERVDGRRRSKFRYISQHECDATDFRFVFMKGRDRDHFPEHKARVVHAGGYALVQLDCPYTKITDDVKVMAFVDHTNIDLDFYHRQTYRHLNIYEAYYENCAYSYIFEFFLQQSDTPVLVEQLMSQPGVEVAVYKDCPVFHS